MPAEVQTPLPIGIWLSELRKLADCCANDNGTCEDRAVRRAFHFLKLSPHPIANRWDFGMSEDELEAMLEQGRARDAASEIIGGDAEIELSSSTDGPSHVAVLRYDQDQPVSARAATPALAMISACATYLAVIG
jgi:hypothetical protein